VTSPLENVPIWGLNNKMLMIDSHGTMECTFSSPKPENDE